jgi:hypothetical protein
MNWLKPAVMVPYGHVNSPFEMCVATPSVTLNYLNTQKKQGNAILKLAVMPRRITSSHKLPSFPLIDDNCSGFTSCTVTHVEPPESRKGRRRRKFVSPWPGAIRSWLIQREKLQKYWPYAVILDLRFWILEPKGFRLWGFRVLGFMVFKSSKMMGLCRNLQV